MRAREKEYSVKLIRYITVGEKESHSEEQKGKKGKILRIRMS